MQESGQDRAMEPAAAAAAAVASDTAPSPQPSAAVPAHDTCFDDDQGPPRVLAAAAATGTGEEQPQPQPQSHSGSQDMPAAPAETAGDQQQQDQQQEPQQEQEQEQEQQQRQVATVLKKIEKWWCYRSYGEVIAGSRVIPMKTPLTLELQERQARLARGRSSSVDANGIGGSGSGSALLPGQEQWDRRREHTIGNFVQEQAAQGRRVGLIVDLSNHDSLYADDLARDCPGLQYRHFHFVAKCVPGREGCARVARCIAAHLATHPEDFVGIHCSYGFNRTGLVCCAYLIEELGLSVDQALAAFAAARPPGVKHQHFIEALRARYSGGSSDDSPAQAHADADCGGATAGGGTKESGKGIIPPAESEPSPGPLSARSGDAAAAATAAVVEDGDDEEEGEEGPNPARLSLQASNNNETLGRDVRQAMLAALQEHQSQQQIQMQQQMQQEGNKPRVRAWLTKLGPCGSKGGCVLS